ncbi:MAG: proton-conducting transporter membrane subunit [Anaerolineales bacterium]|jgi:proton-translocating NADH-quinone oxidoreductase chain N
MDIPAFIWLIFILLVSSPLVYLIGHFGKSFGKRSFAQWAGFIVLLVSWVPLFMAANDLIARDQTEYRLGGVMLQFDGISLLLAALTLLLGTLVALFSGPYLSAEDGQEKFYAALTVMIAVIIGLGCATELFNLWLWFEAMAISSYLLVAFYHKQPGALEAGVKYVVQSAAGSCLVLIAIGLVISQTGTLSIAGIRSLAGPSPLMIAAGVLFTIGFGVKTALVPLHTWLPDAHSQAPSGISAMLSGVVIEAGLVALLRTLSAFIDQTPSWGTILLCFGCLNMLAGNLMAFRQKQVKRLLAYSSIAHVGYMLVGLGTTISLGGADGASGGLFHMLNHGMMKGLAFLAVGALMFTLRIASGSHEPLVVEDLSGSAQRSPLTAFSLSLAVLGLGGIPPLSGFMSKWQIIVAGLDTHNTLVSVLVIIAALNSVFSLAYYAPLINTIYRQEQSEAVQKSKPLPVIMCIPLIVLSSGVVVIGLWPSLMKFLVEPAGASLLAAFGY